MRTGAPPFVFTTALDAYLRAPFGDQGREHGLRFYVRRLLGRLARRAFADLRRSAVLFFCATVSVTAVAQEISPLTQPKENPSLEATMRLLAGLGSSATEDVAPAKRLIYAEHRNAMERAWKQFRAQRLESLTSFSARELSGYRASHDPVFYPFSGPDVVHALALFPQCTKFVLTGLEPVGEMPNLLALDDQETALALADLRRSLHSLLGAGFFNTNDMREAMRTERNVGVLLVLLVLLARHEATIGKLETVRMTPDANIAAYNRHARGEAAANSVEGISIAFRMSGDTEDRVLYYFVVDISDAGLTRTPQYLKWVRKAGTQTTFLKAASYLMHKPYFSKIRGFLLEHSRLLVQDDSGIPYRFFVDKQWERQLYGKYVGPIPLFSDWYQRDMHQAYEKEARPLEFGFGYKWARGTSNLQVMMHR